MANETREELYSNLYGYLTDYLVSRKELCPLSELGEWTHREWKTYELYILKFKLDSQNNAAIIRSELNTILKCTNDLLEMLADGILIDEQFTAEQFCFLKVHSCVAEEHWETDKFKKSLIKNVEQLNFWYKRIDTEAKKLLESLVVVNEQNIHDKHVAIEDKNALHKAAQFDHYIDEKELKKHREKLIPFLLKKYTNAKPQQLAYMIYALSELELVDIAEATANKSNFHIALKNTFGKIGTKEALRKQIANFNRTNTNRPPKIREHIEGIREAINSKE